MFISSASASLKPYISSAPRFQAVIRPSKSWIVIASLESLTTVAMRLRFSSSRLRSVISRQ